ncbi:MAG: hypothetical protein ACLTYN_03935 [Dysosmobacter welbionis]
MFAQLYGTVALLQPEGRRRIRALINKFRGDPEILQPGLRELKERAGIPVLGVVPILRWIWRMRTPSPPSGAEDSRSPVDIAVIHLPRISNFTDFAPLKEPSCPRCPLCGADRELCHPDLVILPGTKLHTADLIWLRESGLEAAILAGRRRYAVLGICGGYQMLGEVWGPGRRGGTLRRIKGMGLLPCSTVFAPEDPDGCGRDHRRPLGRGAGWI